MADPRWPRGLSLGYAANRLLWIARSNPTRGVNVCCECCVLSGRGLCVGLITRPEESYRLWCVCDREASITRRPWPTGGCYVMVKKIHVNILDTTIKIDFRLVYWVL